MRYKKAEVEIVDFHKSEIFMTNSGIPDCSYYGTLHDIYNQRWYTCTFVNIRLEQNKDGYPTYRCDSVNPEPPGGRDIACDIVDVRS